MPHLGEQLVDRLIGYGVRYVFGSPGGQTLPLYNGIAHRPGEIAHVLMHDERSGIYAADAYARAVGHIGVCDATVGPGASNLVSGLVEAYSSSIPVMAIVADIPRHWEHRRPFGGASQAFEQRKFLEGCVKWYGRVETADNLADILHSCIRIATSGRPGPVVLEIPDDIFADEAGNAIFDADPAFGDFPRLRPGADPAAIAEAVAMLRSASRPIVIAGGGALHAGAGEAIKALVETLDVPFATTLSGKGVVPETHPLSVGVVGRFGIPMANTLLAAADCTIFIGSKTGQGVTLDWSLPGLNSPVIHIDVDAQEIGRNFYKSVGIVADAKLGTEALLAAVRSTPVTTDWDDERIAEIRSQWWDGEIEYKEAPKPGILKPQLVTRSMSNLMGDHDALVTDASLSSGWGAGRWQTKILGKSYFAPRGLAGLGWGLPAAVGIATAKQHTLADGGRTVLLAGDGGWGYSLTEVETAARMELPICSVVLNNSTLGWIKHSAARRYPDGVVSQNFIDVKYADAAAAMGAETATVDTIEDFESAFKAALADTSNRPWVIEAHSCDIETPVQASVQTANTKGGY